jgi:hypothetical protein
LCGTYHLIKWRSAVGSWGFRLRRKSIKSLCLLNVAACMVCESIPTWTHVGFCVNNDGQTFRSAFEWSLFVCFNGHKLPMWRAACKLILHSWCSFELLWHSGTLWNARSDSINPMRFAILSSYMLFFHLGCKFCILLVSFGRKI